MSYYPYSIRLVRTGGRRYKRYIQRELSGLLEYTINGKTHRCSQLAYPVYVYEKISHKSWRVTKNGEYVFSFATKAVAIRFVKQKLKEEAMIDVTKLMPGDKVTIPSDVGLDRETTVHHLMIHEGKHYAVVVWTNHYGQPFFTVVDGHQIRGVTHAS